MDFKLIRQLNNFDRRITFNEMYHSYAEDNSNNLLTSVTKGLSKLSEPFRKDYWLTFKALQEFDSSLTVKSDAKKSVQKDYIEIDGDHVYYLDVCGEVSGSEYDYERFHLIKEGIERMWERDKKIGTTRGTIVHNYLESRWKGKNMRLPTQSPDFYLNDSSDAFKQSVDDLIKKANNFYNEYKNRLIPISLEQIVFCPEWGVAGQIDCIFFDTIDEKFYLYDYKTDKKINKTNYFSKLKLAGIDDCNFNKYSLQLSIYKLILEKYTDIKIAGCKIVWFNVDNDDYEIYDLPDYSEKAKIILDLWQQLDNI